MVTESDRFTTETYGKNISLPDFKGIGMVGKYPQPAIQGDLLRVRKLSFHHGKVILHARLALHAFWTGRTHVNIKHIRFESNRIRSSLVQGLNFDPGIFASDFLGPHR